MSIVCKFGGTSIRNAEWIEKALDIVSARLEQGVLLVASAMGKTTDTIIDIMTNATSGHSARSFKILKQLREEHLQHVHAISDRHILTHAIERIELLFDEMNTICIDITNQKLVNDTQQAYLLAHGELLSTTIVYAIARSKKITATLLDSREMIITNNVPLSATLDWEKTKANIDVAISLQSNQLYIAQGFIASAIDGRTTTFSRGGSDYSAAIYGAALGASRIEIWSDVNGIMTMDPRIVKQASTIDQLSYNEAAELAFFGAHVIHPATMLPAIQHGIPLYVRNTQQPEHAGTLITKRPQEAGVRAIAIKQHVTVINIQSYRMLNAYGFLSKIFAIFAEHKTAVDLIATSEVSVSLTIDTTDALKKITKQLRNFAKIGVKYNQTIVSIVAHNHWKKAHTIANVFVALRKIPIRLVTLGASDTNLSFVIEDKYATEATQQLHAILFE